MREEVGMKCTTSCRQPHAFSPSAKALAARVQSGLDFQPQNETIRRHHASESQMQCMSVHRAATVCKLSALRLGESLQVEAAEKCFHVTEAFLQLTACLIRKGVHTATLQVLSLSQKTRGLLSQELSMVMQYSIFLTTYAPSD